MHYSGMKSNQSAAWNQSLRLYNQQEFRSHSLGKPAEVHAKEAGTRMQRD